MDFKMAKVSVRHMALSEFVWRSYYQSLYFFEKYVIEDQKSFPEKVSIKAPLTTS